MFFDDGLGLAWFGLVWVLCVFVCLDGNGYGKFIVAGLMGFFNSGSDFVWFSLKWF